MRIDLDGIEKIYNGKKVVDITDLTLESGKIYAVVGPNGSGKTTLLRIIAAQDIDFKGAVLYNGAEKTTENDIAYMPQQTYMFDLTVLENVMLGMEGSVKSKAVKKRRSTNNRIIAEQALLNVGMKEFAKVKAQTLSGGEAQRVALARTLVEEKSLVLLDEPASATDLSGVELVEKYIKSVNEKNGSTVVFTTHNPSQAAHIADKVIMMYNGKVLEIGSPEEVFDFPRCLETRDFLSNWRI